MHKALRFLAHIQIFIPANIASVVDVFVKRPRDKFLNGDAFACRFAKVNLVVFKNWTEFINKISLGDNFLLQPCGEISCQGAFELSFCILFHGLPQHLDVQNSLRKIFLHDPRRVVKTFGLASGFKGLSKAPGAKRILVNDKFNFDRNRAPT